MLPGLVASREMLVNGVSREAAKPRSREGREMEVSGAVGTHLRLFAS